MPCTTGEQLSFGIRQHDVRKTLLWSDKTCIAFGYVVNGVSASDAGQQNVPRLFPPVYTPSFQTVGAASRSQVHPVLRRSCLPRASAAHEPQYHRSLLGCTMTPAWRPEGRDLASAARQERKNPQALSDVNSENTAQLNVALRRLTARAESPVILAHDRLTKIRLRFRTTSKYPCVRPLPDKPTARPTGVPRT